MVARDGAPMLTLMFPESARQVPLGDDVVVYADEQGSSNRDAGQDFAIGYVFEPAPRIDGLVAGALAKGSAELRAVRRGHFHASADCSPSRKLLADAIRDDGGDLFYSSLRWDFGAASPTQPHKGELHRHVLALALNRITQRKGVRRVELRFARVQGLNEQEVTRWFEEDVDVRLQLLERLPGLPMYFPEIVAREVAGTEPGIQIADHLLWRERRFAEQGVDALEDLGLSLDYKNEPDNAFFIIHYLRRGTVLAQAPSRPQPRPAPRLEPGEWLHLFIQIERFVHRVAASRPAAIAHLAPIMERASNASLGRPAIGEAQVDALCRAFLVAIDTLPGYDVADADQSQTASNAAAFAASVLRKREGWSMTVLDRWLDARASRFREGEEARYLFAAADT